MHIRDITHFRAVHIPFFLSKGVVDIGFEKESHRDNPSQLCVNISVPSMMETCNYFIFQ